MSTKKIVAILMAVAFILLSRRGTISYPEQAGVAIAVGVIGVIICGIVFFKTGK